jgi:hypothetical protein
LLISLAGLVGIANTSGVDHGPPAGPPTGSLQRIEVERTGGIAYQELRATIDDPAAVDALTGLLPSPLPEIEGPTGACADCWVYRIELTGADGEPIVLEFDQANEPPELQPFVDALDDVLG